jgi:hypothetical protein
LRTLFEAETPKRSKEESPRDERDESWHLNKGEKRGIRRPAVQNPKQLGPAK